jgi:hypothetical protein
MPAVSRRCYILTAFGAALEGGAGHDVLHGAGHHVIHHACVHMWLIVQSKGTHNLLHVVEMFTGHALTMPVFGMQALCCSLQHSVGEHAAAAALWFCAGMFVEHRMSCQMTTLSKSLPSLQHCAGVPWCSHAIVGLPEAAEKRITVLLHCCCTRRRPLGATHSKAVHQLAASSTCPTTRTAGGW